MTALSVSGLRKVYGAGAALADVSFEVSEGAFFTLLGPSGCGKTTLLKCVAGLEVPTAGEVRIGGDTVFSASRGIDVPPERRPVGMVFQSYAIWPHMTVFDNVAFPLRYGARRPPEVEIRTRVGEMLERLGLTGLEGRWATQLSGGQQQRLAVARALVREPRVLLLDEPLSNLDAQLRAMLRRELKRFQRLFGVTTVYVTHDQGEALSLSDEITVLDRGVVQQTGKPRQLYDRPATPFVAGFIGAANLIPGRLRAAGVFEAPFGAVACDGAGEGAGFLCVRPEVVQLLAAAGGEDAFPGRVEEVEFLGDHCECTVRLEGATLRVRVAPAAVPAEAAAVWVRLPPERCLVLPSQDGA